MKLIDRYITRQIIAYGAGFVAITLVVLLLERMMRLFDLTVNSEGTSGYVVRMLLNLIPHYLEIAIPAAFFLSVLLTIHRLSENSELTALQNAGLGFQHILRPIMVIAFVLAGITALIVGVLQPHSRYKYRALVHSVAHQSLAAIVREGKFVTVNDLTFLAERRRWGDDRLGKVFVYSQTSDGTVVVTTATHGALQRTPDGNGSILALTEGTRTRFAKDGAISWRLRFDSFQWSLDADRDVPFRSRGSDTREMSLLELWQARYNPPAGIPAAKIAAETNGRLVRAATMLVLPLVAIPLGLSSGRAGQWTGFAVGLFILVLYQKALALGTTFGGLGFYPAWLGAWLPFFALATLGIVLFNRITTKVAEPPLTVLSRLLKDLWRRIRRA